MVNENVELIYIIFKEGEGRRMRKRVLFNGRWKRGIKEVKEKYGNKNI